MTSWGNGGGVSCRPMVVEQVHTLGHVFSINAHTHTIARICIYSNTEGYQILIVCQLFSVRDHFIPTVF